MPEVRPRTRAAALLALAVALGVAAAVLLLRGGDGSPEGDAAAPLAYDAGARATYEQRAAHGLSHVLFAKSPQGVLATAARVARLRPLVERAAGDGSVVDADTLEAIVFLESGGRPRARASDAPGAAAGLTQILPGTARDLLGMRPRDRYVPSRALAGTVRYLRIARGMLHDRLDLAVESYHMGIGNLQRALGAYGEEDIPYAQIFFDSSPLAHAAAWHVLASLGDDSATYLWRVRAAARIMRAFRSDPEGLAREADLQTAKASAENVLHPPGSTPVFADPFAVGRAQADGTLVRLPRDRLATSGIRVDPGMGALGRRLGQSPRLYRALRPRALEVLLQMGALVRRIAGGEATLRLTSTVRDTQYQRLLAASNPEATHAYSLHTTGWAFDVARDYADRAQAQAFQFVLDRLTALDEIAWVREPGAIHVTVARRSGL